MPEVDPTGAGDTFCAGFSVAMLDGLDLRATAVSASVVADCPLHATRWAPSANRGQPALRAPARPNRATSASLHQLLHDAGIDAELIPELEFEQTLGW